MQPQVVVARLSYDIKFPFSVYLQQRFCIIFIHSVSVSQNKLIINCGYLQSAETALLRLNTQNASVFFFINHLVAQDPY